jgi:uncharacterized membrane protein
MKQLKNIFFRGLTLAIPLGVVAYVFLKIIRGFEKVIGPVATRFGIERLLGELTLTFLAVLCIGLLMLMLGFLMKLSFIASFHQILEEQILNIFPWLNQLKVIAADTLDLENLSTQWKPVLLNIENSYSLAFLVNESENLTSFFVVKGSRTDNGELMTIEKKQVKYYPIAAKEMKMVAKNYGKGMIALIEKTEHNNR